MTDQLHPYWGLVKDHYDSTYVYDIQDAHQSVIFSPCVADALQADVAETVKKLCALGEGSVKVDWDHDPDYITLSMLDSVVQHMSFPGSLPTLCNPVAIHGCISLMQSIKRFGRSSPFSYEYGHLCFRILVVALDYGTLLCSGRYDSWAEEVDQPCDYLLQEGHVPVLSRTVADAIVDSMKDGNHFSPKYFTPTPWTDDYTGPLVATDYLMILAKTLADDRKHFLIFLRSNYSLRLSGMLYIMWEFMRGIPIGSEDRHFVQTFAQLYHRALFFAPDSPFGQGEAHQSILKPYAERKTTKYFFDAEDSQLVFHAYADRLMVLPGTGLHSRASCTLAIEMLQYIQPLATDGCEDVLPRAIRATIQCMWGDLVAGKSSLAERVSQFHQLLHAIEHWIGFLAEGVKHARDRLIEGIEAVFEEELVNLVMRMLLEICVSNKKSPKQAVAETLIHAVIATFRAFKKVVSSAYLQQRFHQSIFNWVTLLVNSHSTVALVAHPSRWAICLSVLSKVVNIVGGDEGMFGERCGNSRCPFPTKVIYADSSSLYCSRECYARHWERNSCEYAPRGLLLA